MKKHRTIIEMTGTHIKLYQVNASNVITYCDAQLITSKADEDIAQLLKHMMSSLPFGSKEPVLLIPRQCVILRQMIFPTDKPDEIEDMIGLQLINNIPYPVEDVIYRYIKLEQDQEQQVKVLVAVINKKVSCHYNRILQKAGILDGILSLSSIGIVQWLTFQQSSKTPVPKIPTAVINIDSNHCELCFCHNKNLLFSREFNVDQDGMVEELERQIILSIEMYQEKQFGPDIESVLIVSWRNNENILKSRLEAKLDSKIDVLSPVHGVSCMPDMNSALIQARKTCSLTAGLGLILTNNKNILNLSPEEFHITKQRQQQKRQILKLACLSVFLAALVIVYQMIGIHRKEVVLKTLENKVKTLLPQRKAAEEQLRLVRYFDQKSLHQTFIPDLFDGLSGLIPADISLQNLSLDDKGNLTMEGYAHNHATINDFQTKLIRSVEFENVDLNFSTKRTIANNPVMNFKIASQLRYAKKNKND